MTARASALLALSLALGAAAGAVRAQDVPYLEERLIDVHSLLLDLPPLQAPAALEAGVLDASLEVVTIPTIDGDVGNKHELTASDHTRLFPRPRLMLGLPVPHGLRAFAGLAYLPPVELRRVSTHYLAAEAGLGLAPGPLRLGLRGHAAYAVARSPVTEPTTRDVLRTEIAGADAAVGLHLGLGGLELEPYAGAGLVALRGRFRVTVDGTVLRSRRTGPALHAGLRLLLRSRWEAVAEADAYPGRLAHADLRLGYLLGR
jgi:hypothetical protein